MKELHYALACTSMPLVFTYTHTQVVGNYSLGVHQLGDYSDATLLIDVGCLFYQMSICPSTLIHLYSAVPLVSAMGVVSYSYSHKGYLLLVATCGNSLVIGQCHVWLPCVDVGLKNRRCIWLPSCDTSLSHRCRMPLLPDVHQHPFVSLLSSAPC